LSVQLGKYLGTVEDCDTAEYSLTENAQLSLYPARKEAFAVYAPTISATHTNKNNGTGHFNVQGNKITNIYYRQLGAHLKQASLFSADMVNIILREQCSKCHRSRERAHSSTIHAYFFTKAAFYFKQIHMLTGCYHCLFMFKSASSAGSQHGLVNSLRDHAYLLRKMKAGRVDFGYKTGSQYFVSILPD
jgi:hypothetical protein